MNKSDLIAFELRVAEAFNAGRIRAPVHLSGGNEDQLIDVFKNVRPDDWVCGSWRMHYHCLLKGVDPEVLFASILAGKSITLCYPEHKIISSAIVGGVLPIALGIAWTIKRAGGTERVWTFIGDMTAETGMFSECRRYAERNNLPICFVVEDNGLSVCTDTQATWGDGKLKSGGAGMTNGSVRRYKYKLNFPHAGAGKRIQF